MIVKYTEKFIKQISKLDKHKAILLKKWIKVNIEKSDNPRAKGKALVGNLQGYWRYRVGDYRIISKIIEEEMVIVMIEVAQRREIYN